MVTGSEDLLETAGILSRVGPVTLGIQHSQAVGRKGKVEAPRIEPGEGQAKGEAEAMPITGSSCTKPGAQGDHPLEGTGHQSRATRKEGVLLVGQGQGSRGHDPRSAQGAEQVPLPTRMAVTTRMGEAGRPATAPPLKAPKHHPAGARPPGPAPQGAWEGDLEGLHALPPKSPGLHLCLGLPLEGIARAEQVLWRRCPQGNQVRDPRLEQELRID